MRKYKAKDGYRISMSVAEYEELDAKAKDMGSNAVLLVVGILTFVVGAVFGSAIF